MLINEIMYSSKSNRSEDFLVWIFTMNMDLGVQQVQKQNVIQKASHTDEYILYSSLKQFHLPRNPI